MVALDEGLLGRSERSVIARRRIIAVSFILDEFVAEHSSLATRLQAHALLTLGSLSPHTLGVEHALPLSLSQVRTQACIQRQRVGHQPHVLPSGHLGAAGARHAGPGPMRARPQPRHHQLHPHAAR
jgi:hypothetical protein